MPRERVNREDANFEKKLDELKHRFAGVKKNADGFVTFWSDNSDITQLISRSSGYIVSVLDCGETVRFHVDRKGFRSCYHAFKLSK